VTDKILQPSADHPHADPGDGRTECDRCGKWIWPVTHSCKGVPVIEAARQRYAAHLAPVIPLDSRRIS